MPTYKLSAAIINRTRKRAKLTDGSGLFYLRNADGSLTAWQRVRRAGKDEDLRVTPPVLGAIDAGWLTDIRARAWTLRGGVVTEQARKRNGSYPTFEDAWLAYTGAVKKWNANTLADYRARMQLHVSPSDMWRRPPSAITANDIADAVADVRQEQPLLANRLLLDIRKTFAWLLPMGVVRLNPAAQYMEALSAVETRPKPSKLPAITDAKKLPVLVKAIENSNFNGSLRAAMLLQAFTIQRSGVVVRCEWPELDLGGALWTIPRSKMKVKGRDWDHAVPLHPRMVDMLGRLPRRSRWVFPQRNPERHVQITDLPRAFHSLGLHGMHTPHGWRSALTSRARDQVENGRPRFAEHWYEDLQDHVVEGTPEHYTRDAALNGMREVIAWWGDLLQ